MTPEFFLCVNTSREHSSKQARRQPGYLMFLFHLSDLVTAPTSHLFLCPRNTTLLTQMRYLLVNYFFLGFFIRSGTGMDIEYINLVGG